MKLKYEFETVTMGDENIMVPIGENSETLSGILRVNDSGLEIIRLLSYDTDEVSIIDQLAKKYDNNREVLINYVSDVVDELRAANLLIE